MISLSIIVVSYNTKALIIACLRSVFEQTSGDFEVIVVDNASQDGSASAIAKEFPTVHLITSPENLGFAGANNLAAERASGEFILLLNPDTVILDRAIDKVMDFAHRQPEARIWGGRTLFGDGSLNRASCWRRMTLWNIFCRSSGLTVLFPKNAVFNSEAYGDWARDTERHVDIVTGCFLMIRREDWVALGGFDLTFFMYGEEADLCLRASRELGARPMITPEATLIHYGGASEKVRADKMVRLLAAKSELVKRHFSGTRQKLARAMFQLWPLSRYWAARFLVLLRIKPPGQGATVWGEAWMRRAEWRHGFSARD